MATAVVAACVLGVGGLGGLADDGDRASRVGQVPDYGLDWVTIGAPGNRPANPDEAPMFYPPYWTEPGFFVGDVAHEYRITRTEITVEVWFEFVLAFAPYWEGQPHDSNLTGGFIHWNGSGYHIQEGSENMAIQISWYNAARFCNWLHNGKAGGAWAFEDGAYDTSTFGMVDKNGDSLEQATHHPDALFWIPSIDEWTKAMYYDPDRYGPGEDGYWYMPDGGNEVLVSGWPSEGGETSGGMSNGPGIPVGTYPHATSPWGLLDGSGGVQEWCEDPGSWSNDRLLKSSWQYNDYYWLSDPIDDLSASPADGRAGLRIASATHVPCTADCSGDGELDMLDFVCLEQLFHEGSLLADVNADGILNVLDFVAFQHAFVAGCD